MHFTKRTQTPNIQCCTAHTKTNYTRKSPSRLGNAARTPKQMFIFNFKADEVFYWPLKRARSWWVCISRIHCCGCCAHNSKNYRRLLPQKYNSFRGQLNTSSPSSPHHRRAASLRFALIHLSIQRVHMSPINYEDFNVYTLLTSKVNQARDDT